MMMGTGAASAHTPSSSATCGGVAVTGTGYSQEATLAASVQGGASDSKTFTGTSTLTVPVPQDGAAHTWTASVTSTHGENSQSFSGTVGPCGKPQQPQDTVETKDTASAPNCDTLVVTTTHYSRTIPFVYVESSNSWVPGTPGAWEVTGTSTRHVTQQECDAPPPPAPLAQTRDVANTPDCTVFTTTTEHQAREAIFAFTAGDTWAWEQTGWTDWHTVSTTTADATQEECPPPVQPDPFVSTSTKDHQKCGDAFKTVVTSTSTTGYVLDEATRIWSLGEPVVTTATDQVPVTATVCATTTTDKVKPIIDTSGVLPNTGGPTLMLGLAALLFLLCGFAMVKLGATPTGNGGLRLAGHIRSEDQSTLTRPAVAGRWNVRRALPALRLRHRDGRWRNPRQ
jgi:hypothetical protein